ncbi:MAG: hypothetical protein ABI553_08560 [Chloroflexota bacterium]
MPELPVKDVRLSDLHMPELKREDILRALSEIPRPDVDLSKLERPKFDLPSIDVGKAMAGAAAAAGISRRNKSTRWPLAVGGLIVAGLAAWAILTNEMVRSRLAGAAGAVKERIATMRSGDEELQIDPDEAIAFDAAATHPIESPPYADATVDTTGYPAGLGSNNGESKQAFEESIVGE